MEIKGDLVQRAGDTFISVVRSSMNDQNAKAVAHGIREKYRGLPNDSHADILIKLAVRKTKWEGFASGLGITGCEIMVADPVPEPGHKAASIAGTIGLILGDIAFTTRVQMQLVISIAEIYNCPFQSGDDEDIWTIFKAAIGLKGTEKVGSYSRFIFTETARKQFRKLLRTGLRRAVQDKIIKIAGPTVGRYIAEKNVMRIIPLANAGIGYVFNSNVTKGVGKWAKVKSKVRSSTFEDIKFIKDSDPDSLIWVLPIIFYMSTSDDTLTENELTLYSQTSNRLSLSDDQFSKVESMINDEQLPLIFAEKLRNIGSDKVRRSLYKIALTTAAVNLKVQDKNNIYLAELANYLNLEFREDELNEKINYLGK